MNDNEEPVAGQTKPIEQIEKEIDEEIRKLRQLKEEAEHLLPLLDDMTAPPDLFDPEPREFRG